MPKTEIENSQKKIETCDLPSDSSNKQYRQLPIFTGSEKCEICSELGMGVNFGAMRLFYQILIWWIIVLHFGGQLRMINRYGQYIFPWS